MSGESLDRHQISRIGSRSGLQPNISAKLLGTIGDRHSLSTDRSRNRALKWRVAAPRSGEVVLRVLLAAWRIFGYVVPVEGVLRAAVTAILLLAGAADARAGVVAYEHPPVAGPVLAGERAVWVERAERDETLYVRSAPPDGPVHTLHVVPGGTDRCQFVEDLDANPRQVAVIVRIAERRSNGCYESRRELLMGPPDGSLSAPQPPEHPDDPFAPGPADGSDPCAASAFDFDGDFRALTRTCPDWRVEIRDLSGREAPIDISPGGRQAPPGGIRLAGGYLAWVESTRSNGSGRLDVVVWDRVQAVEVFRTDVLPAMGGEQWTPANYEFEYDLAASGRIAIAYRRYHNYGTDRALGWASPQEPTLHELRRDLVSLGLTVTGDRAAIWTWSGLTVMSLTDSSSTSIGRHTRSTGPRIGFTGERIAWLCGTSVRNEIYPLATNYDCTSTPAPYPPGAPAPAPQAPAQQSATFTAGERRVSVAAGAPGRPRCLRIGAARAMTVRLDPATRRARLIMSRVRGSGPSKRTIRGRRVSRGPSRWRFTISRRTRKATARLRLVLADSVSQPPFRLRLTRGRRC